MNPILAPKLPLPPPLSGRVVPSFAHLTVTQRMPRIGRETLAENNFPPAIVQRFETLISGIPAQAIRPLQDPGAPDLAEWDRYVQPYLGATWLEVPWFFAEEYFYRRMLEATGYFQPGPMWQLDPYTRSKQLVLESCQETILDLGWSLEQGTLLASKNNASSRQALNRLILRSAWGNQGDLSIWSVHEPRPDHDQVDVQEAHLLVNQATGLVDFILGSMPLARIDLILDNCGPELVSDLALVDHLLSAGLVQAVRLHAKAHPTFVSDALIKDIHHTIEHLLSLPDRSTQAWGQRMKEHLAQGRLELAQDFFWNSPIFFWEMPVHIRQEMSASDLVICKGDANYRRLVGDFYWDPATPFAAVVGYFPAPVAILRVLKSELVIGLPVGKADQLDQTDPDWMINGRWGVIEFLPQSTG
jgi:uncharacterized protein with ATP-grasp and redox domains